MPTAATAPEAALCAVILACRDKDRGALVAKEVEAAQTAAGWTPQTQVVALDQLSLESAEQCANEVLATNSALHILINNGGIYDMGGKHPFYIFSCLLVACLQPLSPQPLALLPLALQTLALQCCRQA
jgi:NAD(P)-dependent dehydrogenase (short-subunit alcohol dehydrogenase family)